MTAPTRIANIREMTDATLINQWSTQAIAAPYKNELKRRAEAAGFPDDLARYLGIKQGAISTFVPTEETNKFVLLLQEIEASGYEFQGVHMAGNAQDCLSAHAEARTASWEDLDPNSQMMINIAENFFDAWLFYHDRSNKRKLVFENRNGRLRNNPRWMLGANKVFGAKK